MKIEDLRADLMQMSPEERRQFILNVRKDRRIVKESVTKRKDTAKKKDKLDDLVKGMNDAELEALLAALRSQQND